MLDAGPMPFDALGQPNGVQEAAHWVFLHPVLLSSPVCHVLTKLFYLDWMRICDCDINIVTLTFYYYFLLLLFCVSCNFI